jgi:hypothetical protein
VITPVTAVKETVAVPPLLTTWQPGPVNSMAAGVSVIKTPSLRMGTRPPRYCTMLAWQSYSCQLAVACLAWIVIVWEPAAVNVYVLENEISTELTFGALVEEPGVSRAAPSMYH